MGGGSWSYDSYVDKATSRAGADPFAYHKTVYSPSTPASARVVADRLNPKGLKVRESRDSVEHPNSRAVIVALDVTGSMSSVVRAIHENLPSLPGTLLRKGILENPQILMMAVGDATCDEFPLQVGQFESDNRMEEDLEAMILEGGGGGQMTESYELALYVASRKTDIDCWNKRAEKGFLFLIGDETSYSNVKRNEVLKLIDDTLEADIPLETVIAEALERYEVFFILPKGAMHGGNSLVLSFWRKFLGQRVLELDDKNAVSELIALQISACEGEDIDEVARDMIANGANSVLVNSATKAVSTVVGSPAGKVAKVTGSGSLAINTAPSSTHRL